MVNKKMNELRNHEYIKGAIEAILFTVGRAISVDELKVLLEDNGIKVKNSEIIKALKELKEEYLSHAGLKIYETNNTWMMSPKSQYSTIIKSLTYEQDLTKSVLETLAIIAWKAPVLQSEVIRLRNTKAYDHINLLEEKGFIVKEKFGNSYILKLTDKFFDYFDIDSSVDLRELFKQRLAEFERELKKRNIKKTKATSSENNNDTQNLESIENPEKEKTSDKIQDRPQTAESNKEVGKSNDELKENLNESTNASDDFGFKTTKENKPNQTVKTEEIKDAEKSELFSNQNPEENKKDQGELMSENRTFNLGEGIKSNLNEKEGKEDLSDEIIEELEKRGVKIIKNEKKRDKETKQSKKLKSKKTDEPTINPKEIEEIAKEIFDEEDETDDSIFNRDVDFDEVIKKYADNVQESDAKEIINDAADVFNIEEEREQNPKNQNKDSEE